MATRSVHVLQESREPAKKVGGEVPANRGSAVQTLHPARVRALRLMALCLLIMASAAAMVGWFLHSSYVTAGQLVNSRKWNRALPVSLEASRPGSSFPFFSGRFGSPGTQANYVPLAQISPAFVNAVLAIEDHRFYDHAGIDWIRTTRAAFEALFEGRGARGTSSISQQLARTIYLTRSRTLARKLNEAMVALQLERQWTKEQILERYLNLVCLGHNASFDLAGVGAAAPVFFGKSASDLTLPEAALLAGLIQNPTRLNPRLYPEAALARRRLVLRAMHKYGMIDAKQFTDANQAPLGLLPAASVRFPAAFFIDGVRRELDAKLGGNNWRDRTISVTTTVDLRLQQIAEEVVSKAGERLDSKRRTKDSAQPEISLVALDPRTGAIRALVGGRAFHRSQFNRAYASRQPGSTFKPFVYAEAFQRSLVRGDTAFAPDVMVEDSPLEVVWRSQVYAPANYHHAYRGPISLRTALNISSNVAAVRIAEEVGFGAVAALARKAGLAATQGTPSAALGTYEASPIQLAGAYSIFPNGGFAVSPHVIERVVDPVAGVELYRQTTVSNRILDPRAAYLVTSMLVDVINYGTAARARSMGLRLIAAGKTGTNDDGWFAGFTSELVCVVWVGFDDNRDLRLEGAKAALPIWVEFIQNASLLEPYSAKYFRKPGGVDDFVSNVEQAMLVQSMAAGGNPAQP